MQDLNRKDNIVFPITLAADARCEPIDLTNDQVWELTIQSGEPQALGIQTTYGLRARLMRIFPQFNLNGDVLTNPGLFFRRPQVTQCFPNYIKIGYSPFSGLDVINEFWVPTSQTIACRTIISNTRVVPLQLNLEWVVLLIPMGDGQGMTLVMNGNQPILQGRTSGLEPVFWHDGSIHHSLQHFPSLGTNLELSPGGSYLGTWVNASLPEYQSSLELAMRITARPWDAEIAHIELINASQLVEIETGEPDWNTTFGLSQKTAFSFLVGKSSRFPSSPALLTRRMDQGYSPRRNGSGLDSRWVLKSPLDLYYLASLILPGGCEYIQDALIQMLVNTLQSEVKNGHPSENRGRKAMGIPILACLAWKVYEINRDKSFLAEVIPKLISFIEAWFEPDNDQDGDGFPESEGTLLPDSRPSFARNRASGNSFVESPGVGAFLVNEIEFISRMGKELNQVSDTLNLQQKAVALQKEIEHTWDRSSTTYRHRDRDSHLSNRGRSLAASTGPGIISIDKYFPKPQRICVQIETQGNAALHSSAIIKGTAPSGDEVEEVFSTNIRWISQQAQLVTSNVFLRIKSVEVRDIAAADRVRVDVVDYSHQDISLLLPLWARIPDARRAENLIRKTITNPDRYFLPFGIPIFPGKHQKSTLPIQEVSLVWNQLVCEGLLAYGYREQAAQVFFRLMAGIILSLEKRGAFSNSFDAKTGKTSGEQNNLSGLAPCGLFLDILGVKIISPFSVIITDFNPFPWLITVKYRGLKVIRQIKQTQIIFPDGQSTTVLDPGSHWVSLS